MPRRRQRNGQPPTTDHHGAVGRALQALGIRQILARSPEARGRRERAFGTIQGRLPQELRAAGITTHAAANRYLEEHFVPDFNRRFTARPLDPASAFVPLVGVDYGVAGCAFDARRRGLASRRSSLDGRGQQA